MHDWYRAVCDQHKECIHVLVKSTFSVFGFTKAYLGQDDRAISEWLDKHHGCELRLICRDDQMEAIKPHILQAYHDPIESSHCTCRCPNCKDIRSIGVG